MPLAWGIFFFLQKRHSTTHRRVCLFFLCIALTFSKTLADIIQYLPLSLILQLFYPLSFISIPILFLFYIHNFTTANQKPPKWWYLFFLLPLSQFLLSGYFFYLHYPFAEMSQGFYLVMDKNAGSLFHHALKVQNATIIISHLGMLLVLCASFFLIAPINHDKDIGAQQKHKQTRNRFSLLLCITLSLFVVSSIYHFDKEEFHWLLWLMSPGMLFMGSLIFLIRRQEPANHDSQNTKSDDHRRSNRMDKHAEELKTYFEDEKPWLNPDLKEKEVARHLGISTSYLWELLDIYFDTNFRDFVNSYRVEEFMRLFIADKGCHTNQDLSEKAGFKCYATFLRAFKKKMGTTPHEYFTK